MVPYNVNGGSFLNRFFDEPFFSMAMAGSDMKTDIKETDQNYTVAVDIPGTDKKDIALQYEDDGMLHINVSRSEEKDVEENGFIRHERTSGQNGRSYYLPGVDRASISAKYENGVLNIVLPKNGEQENDKHIEIQ
ncbi:MAG TPA: Hsp20/alpha crystallin family protein [Ruminococcaceae bacterium]|nr:Hsp20/alpha crystallin family protein [Oscillospiraceae bacterium]